MNKIALVIIFALFACLGVILFVLAKMFYPPFTSFIRSIPANVTQFMLNPMETLTQHWQLLASGVTGFAGAFTIANKLVERAKQTEQQLSTQKISDVQNELLTQIGKTEAAQKTNVQLQAQLDQSKDAQAQIASLNQTLTAKQKEVDAATERANEAERLAKALITKEEPLKVK